MPARVEGGAAPDPSGLGPDHTTRGDSPHSEAVRESNSRLEAGPAPRPLS